MDSLKKTLMQRDELSEEVADELIELAAQRVREGEDPEEVLEDEFGLEPDFVLDLLAAAGAWY